MDGNTEAELLLLAPGMLVSEAAPGLKPWLNREDQIFQPHPGEPSELAQPGLMWTNKGTCRPHTSLGLLPPLDRCESPQASRLHSAFSSPASHAARPAALGPWQPHEASSWAEDGWGPVSAGLRVDFVCV